MIAAIDAKFWNFQMDLFSQNRMAKIKCDQYKVSMTLLMFGLISPEGQYARILEWSNF